MVTSLLTLREGANKRASLGGDLLFSYLVNRGHLKVIGSNFLLVSFRGENWCPRFLKALGTISGRAVESKKSAAFSDRAPEW
jgi:hypothetical protein